MKRKYVRKTLQAVSSGIEGVSSTKLPPPILPSSILDSIVRVCKYRQSLGLFDDREDRIQRALEYQEFKRGKSDGDKL